MLPSKVTAAYEQLVTTLEEAGFQDNCGEIKWIRPPMGCFSNFQTETGRSLVRFECHLHFSQWNFRGSKEKSNKKINILLRAREDIERSPLLMISSTVAITYFTIEKGKATVLQSIHFDFDGKQDRHPLFHAQVTKKPIAISAEDRESLKINYDLADSENSWYRDARIPTSDMTFPSVLLCLAADHLQNQIFKGFLGTVRELQKRMPRPAFQTIKESLRAEPDHFCSSHWFAHCSPKAK